MDYHADSLRLLTEADRTAFLSTLTNEELVFLQYDWPFWARPKQLPPDWDWFIWLIMSGRGFGKTRTGAEWVIERVRQGYRRIALVGQSKADVRDTMIEVGDSSILKVSPPDFYPHYEPSKRRLTWPNGAIAIVYSGDEPAQLRGPQHDSAWVDELAKFKYARETWDNLMFGLRIGSRPQVCVTTTPKPIALMKELVSHPDCALVEGSTYENEANLSPAFISEMKRRYEGTHLGSQEIHGRLIDDMPGALWKRAQIEARRVKEHPVLQRIVIALDPAVSSNEESNLTGIIVMGLGTDGDGYVLADLTMRGSPQQWATRAVSAYHEWEADRMIAEVNNGGDMIEHTIRMVDPQVSFKQVRASRGKHTRAEPIAALYEQGKVHHVGMYNDLEDQMCTWVPGDDSPDRMDALVWAATELMLGRPVWIAA